MKSISHALQDLRAERGWTLRTLRAEIARHTGTNVSISYLSELERGDADRASVSLLHTIAFAYGINLGELLVSTGYGQGTMLQSGRLTGVACPQCSLWFDPSVGQPLRSLSSTS